MGKINKKDWAESLENRRKLTFQVKKDIYSEVPPFPREITLDINNRCNHKCFFCANPKIEHYDKLDTDLAFDLMRQGIENGCTDLALQALGEPFMDKRLSEFVREGKRLGYEYIYINTNGALANAKRAQPVIDAGCDSIKFSINANNKEDFKKVHGYDDFDKVLENLKWIYEYRNQNNISMGVYVSSVNNSRSKVDYENINKYIKPYCDNFSLRDVSNQGGSMMELNDTEEIKDGNILGSLKKDEFTTKCVYPFNRIVINPYGYVVACTADFHDKLSIADTRKHSLKEIWEGEIFKFLRSKHLKDEYDDLFCNKCLNNVNCETKQLRDVYSNYNQNTQKN
tara:strand:- start:4037 stop:5056 length:1020 start_codon:yes stop_codon:yes gene_type:complete